MVSIARISQPIYLLVDRFVGLPDSARGSEKVSARAIIFWAFFAIPVGLTITGTSIYNQTITPSSIGGVLGTLGILFAIVHLRIHKDTKRAGFIFGASSMLGLGFEPLVVGHTDSTSLVLLAVTPVIFGFMVNWRACLKSSALLLCYYPLVYISWLLVSPDTEGSAVFLFACAASTFGCGFATGAFALTTSINAARMRRQKEQIQQLAFTDPLTGLDNRRSFNNHLDLPIAAEGNRVRTIMLIDLDDFKSINDRFGHDIGDLVLKETGERITKALGQAGRVFRLGGDEFSIVYDHLPGEMPPEDLSELILGAFTQPVRAQSATFQLCFSLGFDTVAGEGTDPRTTLRNADIALFEAKAIVGSSWQRFSSELGDRVERERGITERLPNAIATESIDVVFQSQHQICDGNIIGFEALARWLDPKFGPIPPTEFIQLAENNDLIAKLDRAMIGKAIREAGEWLPANLSLSVNVSGATLVSDGFIQFMRGQLSQSVLAPRQIQIEITETSFIDSWEIAKDSIIALSDMGVSLALDDFGTGYSSLSYLSAFPIDLLKIDRSFLQNTHQKTNVKVMQSIMDLAESLALDVLIEGVETEHHLSLVKSLGCRKVQGYYYSQPMRSEQCRHFLMANNRVMLVKSA